MGPIVCANIVARVIRFKSFYHRLWECPVFEAARRKFQWGDILPDLPKCLSCHGWPVIPSAWFDLARYFAQLPLVSVSPLPVGTSSMPSIDLFTDGRVPSLGIPC